MFLLQPRRPSLTDFSFAPWFSPKYSESFLSLASRRSSLLSGLLCSPDVVPPFPRRFLPQILWSSQRLPRRFLPRLLRFSRLLPRRFSRLLPHRISRFSLAGSLGFSLAGSLGFSLAGSLGFSLAGSLAPPLVGQAPRGHPVPALHSHLHNSCSSLGYCKPTLPCILLESQHHISCNTIVLQGLNSGVESCNRYGSLRQQIRGAMQTL